MCYLELKDTEGSITQSITSHVSHLKYSHIVFTERRSMSWHVLWCGENTCACVHATIAIVEPNEDRGHLLSTSTTG